MRFTLLLTALLSLAVAPTAFAYIDPNAGSIVLQILLGGLAGLSLFGKMLWRKLTSRRSVSADAARDGDA